MDTTADEVPIPDTTPRTNQRPPTRPTKFYDPYPTPTQLASVLFMAVFFALLILAIFAVTPPMRP